MGNNLFQIAAVSSVASSLGVAFAVPSKVERYHFGPLNGSTELELSRVFESTPYLVGAEGFPYSSFRDYVHRDMGGEFGHSPLPELDGTRYTGYFQSPRYFNREDARRMFRVKHELTHAATARHGLAGAQKVLGVHCRFGGDRLRADTIPFHGLVSEEFYSRAIQAVRDREGEDFRVLVVSDSPDVDGLRVMFGRLHDKVQVAGPQPMEHAFATLSMCDFNVLGNSTFSWWAAYLNAGSSTVVAPRSEWFGPANARLTTEDLFPAEWVCL